MSVPALDAAQRRDALRKAADARQVRAEVKRALKGGTMSFDELLERAGSDPAVANMKVTEALEAMPAYGPVRARQLMTRLQIADSRRLRGLGARQRAALVATFGPPT